MMTDSICKMHKVAFVKYSMVFPLFSPPALCISKTGTWNQSVQTSCNSYNSSCHSSCASTSTSGLTHMQSDSNNRLQTVSKHCSQGQLISFIVAQQLQVFFTRHLFPPLELKKFSRHYAFGLRAFLHRVHRLPAPSQGKTRQTNNMC